MRCVLRSLALLAACLLVGCVTLPERVANELRPPQPGEESPFSLGERGPPVAGPNARLATQQRKFDADALPLATGQIVVSETGDAMSLFFSLFTEDYAPWVHAGILAIEDGEPFVYDATGTMFPIPGLPPTATVAGGVRRVALARFVRGKRVVGFYAPPPGVGPAALTALARAHYARGTPFDPYFDADDTSALYCTEFVALALQAAGAPAVARSPMRPNASLATARDWLRIRAGHLVLAGKLLQAAREVAVWSPELSRAQVEAYFAAKHELHRRFGPATRLGHVFRWTGLSLAMRDDVRGFFDASLALASQQVAGEEGLLAVQRAVAALATQHFARHAISLAR